jgi:pimeloyl-ACP methyl ester carboxylesterase
MTTTTSADGTPIVYDRRGDGPPLVLIDGAMTTRSSGSKPELAERLSERFTVYVYDRRGRGDSGDTLPYAVEREIEDVAAMIALAGAPVGLYGHSSGGCLALEAARSFGTDVSRLAMYEPPYDDDPDGHARWQRYLATLTAALRDGRRGDAAAAFMTVVGMPPEQIENARHSPFWPTAESIAPTLAYDAAVMGDGTVPLGRAAEVDVPTLVLYGDAGAAFMAATADTLAKVMPRAEARALAGQTHDVVPAVTQPVLAAFFGGE